MNVKRRNSEEEGRRNKTTRDAEGSTVSFHGCRNPPSGLEKGRQRAYGKGRGFIASSQVSALHVRVATTERWMLCPGQPSRCWKVRIVKGPTRFSFLSFPGTG